MFAVRFAFVCAFWLALMSAGMVSAAHALGRWQPSTEIAYICDLWRICLTDADRGRVFRLTNANYTANDINWSPDGSQIVFSGNSPLANGVHMIDLAKADIRVIAVGGYWPAWSPDGTQLAYASQWNGDWTLYMHPLNGEPRAIFTSTPTIAHPSWSPDGTRLVFQIHEPDYWHSSLAIINADGSGFQRLITDDSSYFDPVWSPDGSKIAAFSSANGARDLVIMNIATSEMQQIVSQGWSYDGSPAWSPDGGRVAFDSDRYRGYWTPDIWAIYIVNADGSNPYYVAAGTNPAWRPDAR